MQTLNPDDFDNLRPASFRQYDLKYDWDTWLDGKIHRITQGEDFDSNASTMITLLRKTAKARQLKVTLTRAPTDSGAYVLTFAAYADKNHRPLLPPVDRYSINQWQGHDKHTLPPLATCRVCERPLAGGSVDFGICTMSDGQGGRVPLHAE